MVGLPILVLSAIVVFSLTLRDTAQSFVLIDTGSKNLLDPDTATTSGLTDNSRVEREDRIIQSGCGAARCHKGRQPALGPGVCPQSFEGAAPLRSGLGKPIAGGFWLAAELHLPKRQKRFESGSFGRQACRRSSGGCCDHRKRWYKIDCCGHLRVDVAALLLGMCGSDQSGPIAHALREHREHQSGVSKLSVAFVKEESAEAASETLLPDRPISPHPNLVTEAGLKALNCSSSKLAKPMVPRAP